MSRSTRSSSASALVRACAALAATVLAATLAGCSDDGVAAGPSATVTVTATVTAEASPAAGPGTTGAADGGETGEETGEETSPTPEVEPPGESVERIGDFVDVSPGSGFSGFPVFESPSGNLACALHDDGGDGGPGAGPFVECLAFESTWSVPDPGDCDLDWIDNQLALTTDEVHAGGCRGDTFLSDDQTVLQYGEGWDTGRIACVSRQEGVTCQSAESGRGFRISRESYTVF